MQLYWSLASAYPPHTHPARLTIAYIAAIRLALTILGGVFGTALSVLLRGSGAYLQRFTFTYQDIGFWAAFALMASSLTILLLRSGDWIVSIAIGISISRGKPDRERSVVARTGVPFVFDLFALMIFSKRRRDDIICDLTDWYTHSTCSDFVAKAAVAWRLLQAILGQAFDLVDVVATAVERLRRTS